MDFFNKKLPNFSSSIFPMIFFNFVHFFRSNLTSNYKLMNSSFGGGGNGSSNNPTNTPPNPTTPFSHFPNSPHNNGSGRSENNNNGRGRSQTDTTLHLNNNRSSKYSTAKEEPQLEMAADYSNQPYKQRLYELFSLIEREMEAMHLENCALRARLEVQSKGGADRPVTELMETPRKRGNLADDLATQMNETFQSSFGGNEAEQKLSVGGGGKKSTQSRQQKWKSAFKNPSGKLALKVGANFPESKHRFVQSFKGHTDGVWQISAQQIGDSPVNVLGSASADQTAKIWLSDNGSQPLATYSGHTGSVNSIAVRPGHFASNQMTFLTCSGDRNAHIWRLNLEQILERKREKNPTENEDEEFLSNFVQQIHQPLLKLTGHSDAIMSGDWLFGGDQIITASWDRTANLFDAENGKIMKTLSGHDRELTSCSSHPSQKLLATASRDFTFRLWDFREPIHSVAVFQGHNDSVTSVLFSAQWHIVSGSDDRTVKVWDLRNMRSPISAIRLDSAPNGIAICTQTQRNLLAIPMDNRNISIYDLNGNRQTRIPRSTGKCHHRLVTSCCWLPDHPVNNLVTAGFDKQIIGWKVHLPPQIATGNKN